MLNHGFVKLVDSMPRENLDAAIVEAARVSYKKPGKSTDAGLIRHLMRHWHTTPFEMVDFKFYIKMPIFVARQHFRHRTASINEVSARYSEVPDEFFVPDVYRKQSNINKQCSDGTIEIPEEVALAPSRHSRTAFKIYNQLLEAGVSRELARCHLPQSTYTEFYWKINLHNLLHFLNLRMASDAQPEIKVYADAIFEIVKPMIPITAQAFLDFRVNAMTLSGPEIEAIKEQRSLKNPGENRELLEKLERLGLDAPV